jgi:transcriptional regulator with XRE-family HTH domain
LIQNKGHQRQNIRNYHQMNLHKCHGRDKMNQLCILRGKIRMGTKLNPDGTKIRTLRVQRGWTQEQLAEIAGISLRTIQRTEAANCAAFETMRGIAAAFETDFDQLLKTAPCRAPSPEPQIVSTAPELCPGLELEPIVVERQAPSAQRSRTTFLTAVCSLAAGLVTGAVLTSRLDKSAESLPPVPQIVSVATPQIRDSHEASLPGTSLKQALLVQKIVPDRGTKAAIPNRKSAGMDEKSRLSVTQAAETSITADPPSLEVIPQPAPLDLPLQSQNTLQPIAIPEARTDWGALSVLPSDSTQERQDPGAVRQAMDATAKKTSAFVSKASASIKRVF